ncbi:hypothetical protein ES703_101816 [subsurface metagenome]
MSAQQIVIAVGIVAVVLVALYAIAKGRGFKFAAQRGKTKLEMDIAGKQEDSSKPSGESGNIKDVSVLSEGKVEGGDVNIHIGHNIDKKAD